MHLNAMSLTMISILASLPSIIVCSDLSTRAIASSVVIVSSFVSLALVVTGLSNRICLLISDYHLQKKQKEE